MPSFARDIALLALNMGFATTSSSDTANHNPFPGRIIVYTAIIGDIDELMPPLVISQSARYICFSDKPQMSYGVWEVYLAELPYRIPRLCAKRYKVLPHILLPDADYSVWIDGTFQINILPEEAVRRWLQISDVAFFKHPDRDCVYDEARVCIDHHRDNPEILNDQIAKYESESYPRHQGLIAGGVIIRRHNKVIEALNEAWWGEIRRHSIRDQVSLPYVAYKLNIDYSIIPGYLWENEYFPFTRHRRMIL
jgi:hypothetical protein